MNLEHHLALLENTGRGQALRAAIESVVSSNSIVLDAGCGTGLLSLFAARAGACRVVGVDSCDLGVARELARSNGYADRIEFQENDLGALTKPLHPLGFDVLIGMIYYNDPRRDRAQSELLHTLIQRQVKAEGACIPSRIRYTWQILHWPEQSLPSIEEMLGRRIARIEAAYDLEFDSLRNGLMASPPGRWFPRRLANGRVDRQGARGLGATSEAFQIDYGAKEISYPDTLEYTVQEEGTATTIVWTQEILFRELTLFSNESVSWLARPVECMEGDQLRVELDAGWYQSNVVPSTLVGRNHD